MSVWVTKEQVKEDNKLSYSEWFSSLVVEKEDDPGAYLTKDDENYNFHTCYSAPFAAQMVIRPKLELDSILNFYNTAKTSEGGYLYPWLKINDLKEYHAMFKVMCFDYMLYHHMSPKQLERSEKRSHAYVDKFWKRNPNGYKLSSLRGFSHFRELEPSHEHTTKEYQHERKAQLAAMKFINREGFVQLFTKEGFQGVWCQEYLGNCDQLYCRFDAITVEDEEVKIYRTVFVDVGAQQIRDLFEIRGIKSYIPTQEIEEEINNSPSEYCDIEEFLSK